MKRTTILLSLALVLALSFGAAAQFRLSGYAEFDAGIYQPWNATEGEHEGLEFFGEARRRALLQLSASGSSGNLRLVLSFGNTENGHNTNWISWKGDDAYNPGGTNVSLNLNSARIEATGALWKGGQSLTMVAGRHSINYSQWVASSASRRPGADDVDTTTQLPLMNSVEIRGLNVGPFTVSAAHGYKWAHGVWGQDEPTFLTASGKLGDLDATVTAAYRQEISNAGANAERDMYLDAAAELKIAPVAGLDLAGTVAVDTQGQGRMGDEFAEPEAKLAFNVDAKITSIPGINLNGSTWMAQEGFAPRYAQWAPKADERYYIPFTPNRQGFKVAADTTQSGVTLKGGFEMDRNVTGADYAKDVITAGASTKIEGFDVSADVTLKEENDVNSHKTVVGVGTALSSFNVKYTGTIENKNTEDPNTDTTMKNEVVVTTTQDLFFADKVAFNAAVIYDTAKADGKELDYGIDAKWKAPNGIDFVVGYATYNKSGDHFVNKKNPDGFYVRATARVNF